MGFWFEIAALGLLLAIPYNVQRIYLLMKQNKESGEM